jgi:hypothetical protein
MNLPVSGVHGADLEDLASEIRCERCGAPPGARCTAGRGRPRAPHADRVSPLRRAYLRGWGAGYAARQAEERKP